MEKLILETKTQDPEEVIQLGGRGIIMMTPPIDEEYWAYRVRLSDTQAIVGFSKFSTIGIGFAEEEDWNTNLPYSVSAEGIFDHIKHNKGDDDILDEDCITAIQMIIDAATKDKETN